jgi:hypothetical protein
METAQPTTSATREIHDLGVLDLTAMKSPDDLAGITAIRDVGAILVPASLAGNLATIPMEDVGATIPIPDDAEINLLTGLVKLGGDALANPPANKDTLVVVGALQFTSPVGTIGYKRLIVVGAVLAPQGSENAIGPVLGHLTGATVYYPPNARFFVGEDRFGRDFFALLAHPIAMYLIGNFAIESDVPADLLKQKVETIGLFGMLAAPPSLIPLLQVLAVEKYGQIVDSTQTTTD